MSQTVNIRPAADPAGEMTIVVGVSGSPASALALSWAAAEANRLRAQFMAVLIWTIQPRAHYAPAISAGDYAERNARAVAGLAAIVSTVAGDLPPDKVTMRVVEGLPERVLVELTTGADLLVLGSGAGLASGRSIGPVVRACVRHAHCPVVVVGPEGPSGFARHGAGADQQVPAAVQKQPQPVLAGNVAGSSQLT